MGLVGISEGAVPFTLVNPTRLMIVNMVGCAVGSAIAVMGGAVNEIPISGCYGWLLVSNWPIYILGIIAGTAIIAAGAIFLGKGFDEEDIDGVM